MKSMKSRNGRNGGCNTMNNEMNKGFSLIELLVVIAIMGIFIGVSFASIGLIQAGNMTSVTKSIATGIQETRQKTNDAESVVRMAFFGEHGCRWQREHDGH